MGPDTFVRLRYGVGYVTRGFLVGAVFVYSAVLVGLALFRVLRLEGPWWLALPNILLPFLFLPLPLLAPLAFRMWSRLVYLCTGSLLLLFVLLFSGQFLPRAPFAASGGTTLRVMTFNHFALNENMAAIKGAILAQDADIVALQELTPNVAKMVKLELSAQYPHQALRPFPAGTDLNGLGILSRFPLRGGRYSETYRGQRVTVRVREKQFSFINVHPVIPFAATVSAEAAFFAAFTTRTRDRQLSALADVAQALDTVVIAGDFNLSDNETAYRRLSGLMTDAYRHTRAGFGFTFPTGRAVKGVPLPPLTRLDYIWVKGLEATGAYRDCRSSSDHCIVVAEVRLP